MNRQQFEALPDEHRFIASEAYIDGFNEAIEIARSCVLHVGDKTMDKLYLTHRDFIVSVMQKSANVAIVGLKLERDILNSLLEEIENKS
jgi:F0F1-type ATP synthase gamma subunit